jgi:hypothetical protein
MTDNENRISATARIGRDDRLGDCWHSLPDQQERQHGLHHLRIAFGQDGMPKQPVGLDRLHDVQMMLWASPPRSSSSSG